MGHKFKGIGDAPTSVHPFCRAHSGADERIPRHERGKLGLAEPICPFGATRYDDVAQLRGTVPNAQLDARIELEPELREHRARLAHHAGSVSEALVPARRRTEERHRIAGAKSANDDVVYALGILDRPQLDLSPVRHIDAELVERPIGIGEKARAKARVVYGWESSLDNLAQLHYHLLEQLNMRLLSREAEGPAR